MYVNCGSFESYDDFKYKLSICAHLIGEEISPYEKVELDLTMDEAVVRPYVDEETKKKLEEEKKAEEKTEDTKND